MSADARLSISSISAEKKQDDVVINLKVDTRQENDILNVMHDLESHAEVKKIVWDKIL
ncbi:hypothetical protein GCM10027275_05680 [Rhabdobacter roseus]